MKDIALDLGVSVVTVSKVLRNHADISSETRERVLKRMKEMNYQPNLAARALVTGKSHIMGLVVPDLVHSFFAQIAKSMSYVLRDQGYNVFISSSNEDPEFERQETDQLIARRVDALIVASSHYTAEGLNALEQEGIPFVLIDRRFSGLTANFVGIDDEAAGFMATRHLIEQGCQAIAHIGGPAVSTGLGRLAGYRRAVSGHGQGIRPEYVITREHGDDASDITGSEAMKQLLRLNARPDGVFCYNDPTAFGAMKAVLQSGLRVPQDIAIVGCGNVFGADFLRVPLTSIDQQSEVIGQRAARLALSLIDGKEPSAPVSILLEPSLVVRESSSRLGPASRAG